MSEDNRRVILISPSFLDTIQLCSRLARFRYVDGWSSKFDGEAQQIGSYGHLLLAAYYRGIIASGHRPDMDGVAEIIARVHAENVTEMTLDPANVVLVEKYFSQYCMQYHLENWTPVGVEEPFMKTFYEDEEFVFVLQGIVDLLVKSPAFPSLLIVDHKWNAEKREPPRFNNQNRAYLWAFKDIADTICINQVGYQASASYVSDPEKRNARYLRSYPGDVIDEWYEETLIWVKEFVQRMKSGVFPGNSTSCDKFRGCYFRDACSMPPRSREWKIAQMFEKKDRKDIMISSGSEKVELD